MAAATETGVVHPRASFAMNPHPPMLPKMKLRLDPQRALEPARKKLSTVEAQRIMASLVVSIKRTELVTALPNIMANLDRYRVVVGDQIVQAIENHQVIINSFSELRDSAERLMEKQQRAHTPTSEGSREIGLPTDETAPSTASNSARNSPNQSPSRTGGKRSRMDSIASIDNQVDMTMKNLSLVAKQMQFSCRNILRLFNTDPSAMNAVLKVIFVPLNFNLV